MSYRKGQCPFRPSPHPARKTDDDKLCLRCQLQLKRPRRCLYEEE